MLRLAETRHNAEGRPSAAWFVPIFLVSSALSKRLSLSLEYCWLGLFDGGSNDWSESTGRLPLADGGVHVDGARGLRARRSVIRPCIGNVQLADRRWQSRIALGDLVASRMSQTP